MAKGPDEYEEDKTVEPYTNGETTVRTDIDGDLHVEMNDDD